MNIPFGQDRMEQTKETYDRWRRGRLGRPLLVALRTDWQAAGAHLPGVPFLSQKNCHDLAVPAADVIDKMHYALCHTEFFGDAYPVVNFDCFGPGVVAACCGARLDNSSGGVWFHPPENRPPIADLHLAYDPNNRWAVRIKDLYAAGVKKWGGEVIMGMADLGGTLDILSTFFPGEELLLALYDEPDEVKRLIREAHDAWLAAYNDFDAVLLSGGAGARANWCGMLSRERNYILQCDFSYMIGNDMFREFARDEIAATGRALGVFDYHLDGVGSLAHLDDILAMPELVMFQWAPGAGKPTGMAWLEQYRRALDRGKLIQLNGSPEDFAAVCDATGAAEKFYYRVGDDFAAARRLLEKYAG